jgi:hypothetical protein
VPEPVWASADNSPLQGYDAWAVQLVASHYTDYAIPAQPRWPQVLVNSSVMKGIQIILNFTKTVSNIYK